MVLNKLIVYTLVGKKHFEKYQITPTEIHSMDTMCNFALNVEDKWCLEFYNNITDDSGQFKEEYNKSYLYSQLDKHFESELKYLIPEVKMILYQNVLRIISNGQEMKVSFITGIK